MNGPCVEHLTVFLHTETGRITVYAVRHLWRYVYAALLWPYIHTSPSHRLALKRLLTRFASAMDAKLERARKGLASEEEVLSLCLNIRLLEYTISVILHRLTNIPLDTAYDMVKSVAPHDLRLYLDGCCPFERFIMSDPWRQEPLT